MHSAQCGKTRNSVLLKKISSNQQFSDFFSKTIAFTEFLLKNGGSQIPVFPHCAVHSVEKREILSHWKEISSNQLFSNFFSKTIAFTNFLRKKCEREFLQFPHCVMNVHIPEFYVCTAMILLSQKFRQINIFVRAMDWRKKFVK